MTSGATLYLVSACSTAEEFVAAFRRYADRTGLFVPSASPLPVGRKGRLALTLKDGGVMISGEAEVIQSSTKATVLHGRPGMTVRFVVPDELSKVVISELEKARLAMKPAPPSVPPRPAEVPAEPRPVPPPIGGRIDAANSLAECVVIGDTAALVDTAAGTPRVVTDAGSGKAGFVVPSIPPSGSESRARTPSAPPKLTSIGFPVLDRAPAPASKPPVTDDDATAVGAVPTAPTPPRTDTTPGVTPPRPTDTRAPVTDETTEIGLVPAPRKPVAAVAPAAPSARAADKGSDEPTEVGSAPTPARPAATPAAATSTAATSTAATPPTATATPAATKAPAPTTEDTTDIGAAPAPSKPAPAPARTPAAPASTKPSRPTSIGVPVAQRTVFETQPVGTVKPPLVPGDSGSVRPVPSVSPRGKSATRPPMTPRHPTPVAPVPIVRAPAKAAPTVEVEEERTDLTETPEPPPSASPLAYAETVDSGRAYAAPAAAATAPQRSGGMRASEILAAVPTDDWTMTPDASAPTVLPSAKSGPTEPTDATDAPDARNSDGASAPGKMPPKGPPTGNWSISLDPDTGWSEPVKVEAPAAAPVEAKPAKSGKSGKAAGARARQASSGNPVIAVSSDKAIVVQQWEDKPTGIGEAKIEIDSTLMEPLTPMPALPDEPSDRAAGSLRMPSAGGTGPSPAVTAPASPGSTGPQRTVGAPPPVPGAGSTGPQRVVPPPSPPSPFEAAPRAPAPPPPPPVPPPSPGLFAAPPPMTAPLAQHAASLQMASFAQPAPPVAKSKRRTVIIALASLAALAAGFALVLVLTGSPKGKAASAKVTTAPSAVHTPDAAAPAVAPPAPDSRPAVAPVPDAPPTQVATEPAPTKPVVESSATGGTCKVAVTSAPGGADIFDGDKQLGTTPTTLELPCGVEVKLSVRKARYVSVAKSVTPAEGSKVALKLGRPTYTVKVTSSPPGATITINGKSMGVTPAQIHLPAFESSPVMLSKPGFQTDSDMLTPKANNTSHHVVLKKKGKR